MGDAIVHVHNDDVSVQVGDVRLYSEERWGAHARPGYLMDVEVSTHVMNTDRVGASYCASRENRHNRIRQLKQSESMFGPDYTVRMSSILSPGPPSAFSCHPKASLCGCARGIEWNRSLLRSAANQPVTVGRSAAQCLLHARFARILTWNTRRCGRRARRAARAGLHKQSRTASTTHASRATSWRRERRAMTATLVTRPHQMTRRCDADAGRNATN